MSSKVKNPTWILLPFIRKTQVSSRKTDKGRSSNRKGIKRGWQPIKWQRRVGFKRGPKAAIRKRQSFQRTKILTQYQQGKDQLKLGRMSYMLIPLKTQTKTQLKDLQDSIAKEDLQWHPQGLFRMVKKNENTVQGQSPEGWKGWKFKAKSSWPPKD